jgi:putative transcriptional regulator
MKKQRDIFGELSEGFAALRGQREGKVTLRTFKAESKPAPSISAREVVVARERLHVSRPVFARYLRTNPRTLENWEQGRAKPNAQAALLIRMVSKHPDIVELLEEV